MPKYLIKWEIEVEAATPQVAADKIAVLAAVFTACQGCSTITIDLPKQMIRPSQPRFQHNCKGCTFLGPYKSEAFMGEPPTDYDLYFCLQGGNMPTVMARFSDNEPDYASGLYSNLPWLKEAKKRAEERKLLPFKKK